MPAMIDRKYGCFYPTRKVGTTFLYNFDYLEFQLGRKFDNYSTFIDYGFDFEGRLNDDIQQIIVGGAGLTSFTLTFSGQTTASIAASATAATVKTELEALSNIGSGQLKVTGVAGGPWNVIFSGSSFTGTNVAQLTATATGGTGTVTVPTGMSVNGGTPGTRSIHRDLVRAMETGHDLFIGFQPILSYSPSGTYNSAGEEIYIARYGTFAELLAGAYDNVIDRIFTYLFAQAAANGRKVTVRQFWEANLPDSIWHPGDAAGTNGVGGGIRATSASYVSNKTWTTTGRFVCETTQEYKDAYAYLTNRLRALPNGSTVFKSAYIPGNVDARAELDNAVGGNGATITTMYPGDGVVDYVGFDIYNGLSNRWITPLETLRGYRQNDLSTQALNFYSQGGASAPTQQPWAYDLLAALTTKDIWIGEIGCLDQNDAKDTGHVAPGNSKAQWYADLYALDTSTLPRLTCINWFDSPGTRNTYPFNSSPDAYDSFIKSFRGVANSTLPTAHGVAAADYDVATADPFDPAPEVTWPPNLDYIPGQPGVHAAITNKVNFWLTQVINQVGSWWAGRFGTDGNSPALVVTGEMGDPAQGGPYIPMVDFSPPPNSGGYIKFLFGSRTDPDAYYQWVVDKAGRLLWGPGDTGNLDTQLQRAGAGHVSITGSGGTDGRATVANVNGKYLFLTDQADPGSPGVGAATVYVSGSGLKVRNAGGVQPIRPSQVDRIFGTTDFSVTDPAAFSTTGTGGPILVAGVMLVWIARAGDARTSTRMSANVLAAGVGLTSGQCFGCLYDSTGALIAQTADQSTAWTTTGLKNMNWVTPVAISAGATYYVNLLAGGGTTMPRFVGLNNSAANWSSSRFGTYGTAQTSPPSTITTGSVASSGNIPVLSLT